jgi:hypothetical protein
MARRERRGDRSDSALAGALRSVSGAGMKRPDPGARVGEADVYGEVQAGDFGGLRRGPLRARGRVAAPGGVCIQSYCGVAWASGVIGEFSP